MRQFRSVAIASLRQKARPPLTLRALLTLAAIGLANAACGQKGPLVLPKPAPAASAASAPTQ